MSSGGQGTTLLCHRKDDKETISAIKVLNKQKDSNRRARMYREAAALSTLDHKNICRLIDTNAEYYKDIEYDLFISTEYIPGPTLSELNFSNVSLENKIIAARKILEVIKYCHDIGVIHRDIKPDNIILRNSNFDDPVLLDFGLTFNANRDDDDRTPSGEHLGNRFLILPEQKVGETSKRDFRSDVSCAVGLFFYFITGMQPVNLIDENGRKPHQRPDAKNIIDLLPNHEILIINSIFDIGFEPVIGRRWQTANSVIEQLNILENSTPEKKSELDSYIEVSHRASTYFRNEI